MTLPAATHSSPTLLRLKALAHDIRYRVLRLLASGELCVCDLEAALELPQSKVSYHLAVLREAGLVSGQQRGKNSYYRLNRAALYALGGDLLAEVLAHDAGAADEHRPDC